MTILPLDPAANATPAALYGFLSACRDAAAARGRPQLASISIEVEALDPLAVLESIFEPTEPHFYAERPVENFALAGAEAVLNCETAGPDRFAAAQRFIDETLAHTIAVGDQTAPFAGPHFFCGFTFAEEPAEGQPFPPARIFVPRWQVARWGSRTVAVANLPVTAGADLNALVEKVWRAHAKFGAFDYATPDFSDVPPAQKIALNETGDYCATVRRGLEFIATGELQKIVLARAKDLAAAQPLHPLRLLNGLRQRFAGCYAFSIANGRGQSFIGASPERLLRVHDGMLQTEALAGSARRGATASDDAALGAALRQSEKDQREHRLVLDSILRRLAPLGLRPEFSEKPGLLRLANVQHLHTPVRAALPADVRLLDVLARLHPTPAVGGSPRAAAMARIRELENFSRGLYGGALGWIDARGGGEFFVGLRSALVDGARARLYAGAGVVAGSSPEKELAETELKFKAMQDALLTP
ncbi:MAG TPA: isochorismate synthase [Opitutaceae bacterium]|nr:isochorismate synthase [Opitutaceae bacterium]